MNYKKIYKNLILKVRKENRQKGTGLYYEKHHILPKCLGGLDDVKNYVLLNAKEHFIAHKLLTKMFPRNISIARAFNLMTHMNKNKYSLSSRDYAYAVELYRSCPVSEETKEKIRQHGNKGRKFSQEFKDKISKTMKKKELFKGENNPMYGKKHSEESLQKMRNRFFSEESKLLMSQNHANVVGEHNPMYGKKFKWMTNGKINKRVDLDKVDNFTKEGWKTGQTRIKKGA